MRTSKKTAQSNQPVTLKSGKNNRLDIEKSKEDKLPRIFYVPGEERPGYRCCAIVRVEGLSDGSDLSIGADIPYSGEILYVPESQVEGLRGQLKATQELLVEWDEDIEIVSARERKLKMLMMKCMAHAGHPDAAEGCRLIIATCKEALGINR